MEAPVIDRYAVRPGPRGWRVLDVWTGEPVVIAMVAQTELSREDAEHTAVLLNRRARAGDRKLLQ